MLVIKDNPGSMSARLIKAYFEKAIADTKVLADNVPLERQAPAVEGSIEYADPKAHAMWVGFALGMRAAERIAAVKANQAQQCRLNEVANEVCGSIPEGFELRVCMERGAGWIELLDAAADRIELPDAADKSLDLQVHEAVKAAAERAA